MRRDYQQHKKDEVITIKAALKESLFRIIIACLFGIIVYRFKGGAATSDYFSWYLMEKSLSIDNLFVMMAIFTSFHIPKIYRHRVLYYGILGAIILRLLFISLGVMLLSLGTVVLTIFGVIVILTAIKMLIEIRKKTEKTDEHDYSKGGIAKLIKKFFPVAQHLDGHNFFTKINGKTHITALFIALIVIELSDVLFAFDSLPAILSITQDTFIVFSSNIFAILGLRALYFVIERIGEELTYISYAVIGILFFVGIKMIMGLFDFHISSLWSLGIIIWLLGIGAICSIISIRRNKKNTDSA